MITYTKSMHEKVKSSKERQYLCSIDFNQGSVRFQGPVTKETSELIGNFLLKLIKEKKL